MSSPLYPTTSLRKKVNPDGAKSAGPLLYGWARRASRGMVSTPRHVRALVNYLPVAPSHVFQSLGGLETLEWANKAVDEVGLDDSPETTDPGQITVLGLPYGGPNGGKDSDGQYFSPLTDFFDGVNDSPPVYYTHGSQNGFEPEPVGKVKKRWYDRRGGWFKLELDPQSPRYSQLLEAHETGNLRASSGVVPASYSADDSTGHIDTWLVGEMSLVDIREGYKPVNGYAVAKATYEKCDTLFTDYYGDPVNMDWIEQLKDHVEKLLMLLSGHKETGMLDDPHDFVGDYEGNDATYYAKATGEFGGKKRSDLADSDFLFPATRSFPVKDCEDVRSAVNSWGRYKGDETFETFKSKLTARAKSLDCEGSLPDNWKEDMDTEEKCLACDEAEELAKGIKAEIAQEVAGTLKCAKCPEAVNWVKAMFKAGKINATEAFEHLETFTKSDDTYDTIKAEVEARTVVVKSAQVGVVKSTPAVADLFVAGGQGSDPQSSIDQEHMNKQRRLVGLPVKK